MKCNDVRSLVSFLTTCPDSILYPSTRKLDLKVYDSAWKLDIVDVGERVS